MYQSLITLAVINSFFSGSPLYYKHISPVNSNKFSIEQKECQRYFASNGEHVAYNLSDIGNQMYKVVNGDESLLKVHYGESESLTPSVYLNLSDDIKSRTVFPLKTSSNTGIPETNTLASQFKCHDYIDSKEHTYTLELPNGVKLVLAPRDYSDQTDVTTDLCVNNFQFNMSMDNEVVMNKFILDKFCHIIDPQNKTFKVATNFQAVAVRTEPTEEKKTDSRLLKPVAAETEEKTATPAPETQEKVAEEQKEVKSEEQKVADQQKAAEAAKAQKIKEIKAEIAQIKKQAGTEVQAIFAHLGEELKKLKGSIIHDTIATATKFELEQAGLLSLIHLDKVKFVKRLLHLIYKKNERELTETGEQKAQDDAQTSAKIDAAANETTKKINLIRAQIAELKNKASQEITEEWTKANAESAQIAKDVSTKANSIAGEAKAKVSALNAELKKLQTTAEEQ